MEKIKKKYRTRNALNSKQAYEKIKQILISDLDYTEDEIEYNVVKDILIIKSIIIIAWDDKSQEYCFSISVTIEPFGFSCLLSYLFKHGFLNIRMVDRFYMRNEDDGATDVFTGSNSIKQYQKDFRDMVKTELADELFQMKILYDFPCKTVH